MRELNQLIIYESVVSVMDNTDVGKSLLCNELFCSKVCSVNAVVACTRKA